MKPFITENCNQTRMLTLARWAKRHKRFGAYIEVEELPKLLTDKVVYCVKVFCNKMRVDKFGNRYVP